MMVARLATGLVDFNPWVLALVIVAFFAICFCFICFDSRYAVQPGTHEGAGELRRRCTVYVKDYISKEFRLFYVPDYVRRRYELCQDSIVINIVQEVLRTGNCDLDHTIDRTLPPGYRIMAVGTLVYYLCGLDGTTNLSYQATVSLCGTEYDEALFDPAVLAFVTGADGKADLGKYLAKVKERVLARAARFGESERT